MTSHQPSRRNNGVPVSEILERLNLLFPPALAEEWDNVGLLVGDPAATVKRIGLALEATTTTVRETADRRGNLLITHHPFLFHPLRAVDLTSPAGMVIATAVRREVAVVACHTNADWAPGGVSDVLAERLDLRNVKPFIPRHPHHFYKLVVFVPASHTTAVAEAIFQAGGGRIGDYEKCSFRSLGEGSYLPREGATPFAGRVGELSSEPEIRLEIRVPESRLTAALAAMHEAHPYQEVAYDVLPTERQQATGGMGRIGDLAKPQKLAVFAKLAAARLGVRHGWFVGDGKTMIQRVIVCGGAGASLLEQARGVAGAVLVTGDLKYHEARLARENGQPVVDLSHYGTERPFIEALASRLASAWPDLSIFACRPEGEPLQAI